MRLRSVHASAEYYLKRPLAYQAHYEVARAIRKGELARPATKPCVDCGEQAEHYDHRDYRQPLSVEPVCRKCNYKRGPGAPYAQPSAQKPRTREQAVATAKAVEGFRDEDVKLASAVLYTNGDEYGAGEVTGFDYDTDTAEIRTTRGTTVRAKRDDLVRISHDSLAKFRAGNL